MTRTVTVLEEVTLSAGVVIQKTLVKGTYHNGTPFSYNSHTLEGLEDTPVAALSQLSTVLKNLPKDGAIGMDYDDLEGYIKDWASEFAEQAELPFTYTNGFGITSTYTPASLWESSGGCEWETSAQEGYDYGWNI